MHIHILGICGTFMGSLAILAKQMGYRVSGCDANVYPPMSTQLEEQGIELMSGYEVSHLMPRPDLVVIGNALSRGNPMVEHVLDNRLAYTSGPQWLRDYLLKDKWVLAVAGTHGKTSTSSMLAWILEYAGLNPGYLIGGIPKNFNVSARLGKSAFFVVEADEYDSAFFDKRSKFVHYLPRTTILNNLEFDHGDIFPDLEAIQRQFHHLVRTIPSNGLIVCPAADQHLQQVLDMGCWTPVDTFGLGPKQKTDGHWHAELLQLDGSAFKVMRYNEKQERCLEGEVHWSHNGLHNVSNAMAAILAAHHVGVATNISAEALCQFQGVKRRMDKLAVINDITVYDDFAHHPTAIASTLQGLRARVGNEARILAIIEPRSNTMRMGTHKTQLAPATVDADEVYWYQPADMDWRLQSVIDESQVPAFLFDSIERIINTVVGQVRSGDNIVIMSNGGFEGIHQRLLKALDSMENDE